MFTGWAALLVATLALSACTTTWSRPATSPTEFDLDNRACQNMNTRLVMLSSGPVGAYVVPSGYQRCMREEGYTEGGPWTGTSGWLAGGSGVSERYRVRTSGARGGAP
jgi:hypothetical protein